MRTILAAAAAFALAACATSQPRETSAEAACAGLPGAAEILAMRDKRYFIVGEIHGTAETPQLFGDLVCLAARQGPVIVGLEMLQTEQPLLDAYLEGGGSEADRAALLAGRHWMSQDGRASQAMLGLVERLRIWKAAGRPLTVVAFVPVPFAPTQRERERATAQLWQDSLGRVPRGRLIALVGNSHARRTPFPAFEPAAMHMPQDASLTIDIAPVGGFAWNCQQRVCGHHRMGAAGPMLSRGIHPLPPGAPPAAGGFDRWMSPGRPFTASPPAVAPPSPQG